MPITAIENFFRSHGDKRVAELRFMDNPWQVLMISSFYIYFCYDLGPHRLMKNRKPFDLVWTVRAFNTFILLLNIWLLKRHFTLLNWGLDSLGCSPVSENDKSVKALEHINICHIFLYSRILELIDTLWICLRKKNRQITFLHVFHHSFVLLMTWFYIKFAPGGSTAMFPIVNGMVHTIMYLYYILSTFESVKPYLWWKKYVTTIQLIQFVILGVHFAVAAMTPNCGYPRALSLTGVGIAGMFFALFAAFYKETYTSQQRLQMKQQQQQHQRSL